MDVAICCLLVIALVTSTLVCPATILIRVCDDVITESALLSGQTIFIRTGRTLPALG